MSKMSKITPKAKQIASRLGYTPTAVQNALDSRRLREASDRGRERRGHWVIDWSEHAPELEPLRVCGRWEASVFLWLVDCNAGSSRSFHGATREEVAAKVAAYLASDEAARKVERYRPWLA